MASDEKIKNIFGQFEKAFSRLKEAVAIKEESEIKRDVVIKRFEFTYELLWKMIKRIAAAEKIEAFSPKSAFSAGLQLGLIDDESLFVEIIDARNKTSHVYSELTAQEIYDFILEKVVVAFDGVKAKISQKYI